VKIVAAVDKFRGSASAAEVAAAIGHACWERSFDCVEVPMADGGEGLLDVLGGANRTPTVTGPLGSPVEAAWRLHRGTAVIEMARASGLLLAGGAGGNDPLTATTAGTGELIDAAITAGAKRIIVGLGGSATTDGGLGALQALRSPTRLRSVDLAVACDVTTRFTDAASVFGPQKGATDAQVKLLSARLHQLADRYRHEFGIDVDEVEGSGAAGGIAGLLAALGGRLVPGFELVADEVDLYDHLEDAELVITGEGHLDRQSFAGKVVGGVVSIAADHGVPAAAIVGIADAEVRDRLPTIAIADEFGLERAMREPQWCVERAAGKLLDRFNNQFQVVSDTT
jgi:glycerate kinase